MRTGLPVLLTFWAAFGMALISPGPNFALMLKIGLGSGRRAALWTVLGIAVGEAIWGLAAVFGVAALALHYPMVGTAIRWAGGLFLLRLGFGALRSAWRNAPPADAATAVPGGFGTGLGIMLLNPKAGFFWISLTGVLLGPGLPPSLGLLAIGVAVLLSLSWHTALALAFSGSRVTRVYARARRGIETAVGAALTALGLRLLATG